ncbi:MAG: hypothetical protein KBD64_04905 [Gammaproteobacteria bacterium]|nr:hypothetical protein [Gammaproteobacteria bacterium]
MTIDKDGAINILKCDIARLLGSELPAKANIELIVERLLNKGASEFNFYWYCYEISPARRERHLALERVYSALIDHGFLTAAAPEGTTPVTTPTLTPVIGFPLDDTPVRETAKAPRHRSASI